MLTGKDKEIIRILNKDSRQSATAISKQTGIPKHVISYRIKNLLERGIITQFITYIDIKRLGYTFYNVFFKLRHYSEEEEQRVFSELAKIPEVGWLVKTRGEWKLIVCFLSRDALEFNNSLERALNILGDKVLKYDFSIVIDAFQLPYKQMLDAPQEDFPIYTKIGSDELVSLNDTELKVLSVLADDARISKKSIAAKTNLTLDMVRHAMKKLEKSKVIQAYKPLIDVMKLGYSWHIMLIQFNNPTEEKKQELLNFLKLHPAVYYIVRGGWKLELDD